MCLRSPARTTTQRSSLSAPMRCPTVASRAAAMLANVAMGEETLPFSTLLSRLRERLALVATSPRLRPWLCRSRRMRRPMRVSMEVFPVFPGMKLRWILGDGPGDRQASPGALRPRRPQYLARRLHGGQVDDAVEVDVAGDVAGRLERGQRLPMFGTFTSPSGWIPGRTIWS